MARVLVVGDTHCPVMMDGYADFLSEMIDWWDCDRIVHIGDLVDWASISYHPKAPSLKNSEAEFERAFSQVQELYQALGKDVDWLVGNHDALTERQATDLGLPLQVLKEYDELWQVSGWNVIPRYGTLTIDGVLYQHGDRGKQGRMAALNNAKAEFCSVVQGHTHSQAGVEYFANHNLRVFGMQVGCGVDYRKAAMSYGKKFNSKPILGCGIVLDGHTAVFEPMDLGNKYGVLK
jgi:predicted phosphodiesterase